MRMHNPSSLSPEKLDYTDPLPIFIPFVSTLGWGLLNMGGREKYKNIFCRLPGNLLILASFFDPQIYNQTKAQPGWYQITLNKISNLFIHAEQISMLDDILPKYYLICYITCYTTYLYYMTYSQGVVNSISLNE